MARLVFLSRLTPRQLESATILAMAVSGSAEIDEQSPMAPFASQPRDSSCAAASMTSTSPLGTSPRTHTQQESVWRNAIKGKGQGAARTLAEEVRTTTRQHRPPLANALARPGQRVYGFLCSTRRTGQRLRRQPARCRPPPFWLAASWRRHPYRDVQREHGHDTDVEVHGDVATTPEQPHPDISRLPLKLYLQSLAVD